jgi:AcrR family transcriptional regulator
MVELQQAESTDPRIVRSRRMLMDALVRLLNRKEFEEISIQEIADEATLNRATFYLHYPDKNALLQAVTQARFRDLIERRGLSFENCDGALRAIALGVCDYLTETVGCPSQLGRLPFEGSIIAAMEEMFREGGRKHAAKPGTDRELLATTAAWAIFGAARRWYQTPNRIPAEEIAEKIEQMVKPVFLGASA